MTKLTLRLFAVLGIYLVYRSIACGTQLPLFYFDDDNLGSMVGRVVFYYALPFAAYLYLLFRSTVLGEIARAPRSVLLIGISVVFTGATLALSAWWCLFVTNLRRY